MYDERYSPSHKDSKYYPLILAMKLQFFSPFFLFGFEIIETIENSIYFIAVLIGSNGIRL